MSTIPIQNIIIDDSIDIGVSSDLFNGTYKTASLTDLSNNVYAKISDLSSNVYTSLSTKQANITASTNLIGIGTSITALNYNNITLNKPDLTVYAIKSNVDSSLNTINTTLSNKQNTISVSTPLIKDVSNNITIDLSAYPLKTYVDGSLNTINTTLSNKQNTISVTTPLRKDVSNNLSIDLSGYTLLSSFNTLSSTVGTKENVLTFSTPLTRNTNTIGIDLSGYTLLSSFNTLSTTVGTKENALTFTTPLTRTTNTIGIDLSAYPLKTYVDGSLNTINTTLSNKQNTISVSTPLIKDVSNNITIDLSAYPLKTYVDGSLNTINTTLSNKQNTLTFSNPLLNTTNTISFKYNTSQFSIDASGNLALTSSSSYLPLSGGTLTGALSAAGSINITGATNAAQTLYFRSTDYNIGIAGATGNYSAWSAQNDMIIRTLNNTKLILQSGNNNGALCINSSNSIGIGTNNPSEILDLNGNIMIRASESGAGGTKGIYFRPNYNTVGTNNYNCSIITYDHNADSFADGISINGYDGISFCTGLNTRNERMRINVSGNVGIGTNDPLSKLDVRGQIASETLYIVDANSYPTIVNNQIVNNQYALTITPPTATAAAKIQTIRQGFGYQQRLIIQGESGATVGIGTTGAYNYGTFDVGGDNTNMIYSFFSKLRLCGNDPNTIWQTSTAYPHICLTTSSSSSFIYHSIGNGTIKTTTGSGGFGINTGYNVNPRCHLEVNGIAAVHNGSPYAIANTRQQSGSLTIGGTNANYGGNYYTGANWTGTNTAGLLMECQDNTEIVIHDSGNRLASFMYYSGNNFYIGKDIGWGTTQTNIQGLLNLVGGIGMAYSITVANGWLQYTGISPTSVADSLIFQHRDTGTPTKNSFWWFNGSQTATSSEISDKRSKYNIQDFEALETIIKLKPKSFDVIDDKDVNYQFGFIAQDIEEIPELSKLVYTTSDYIANVNSYGNHTNENGECIITANDDLTGKIAIGDEIKFVSNNQIDQEFIIDATPYINRYKRRYAKITEIISPTEFKVDCEINNFCSIEDPFLIYGKKVNDAKSLDYNSFIALNTKAIQDLYTIIQKQQEQINFLLSKLS